MTFYPNIYVKKDTLDPVTNAHEQVHLNQQKRYGKYRYLIVYFWKWAKNIKKYGFGMKAYFAIDWEREAYHRITPGYLTYLGHPELDSNPFEENN